MANTPNDFASPEETQQALELLIRLQDDPLRLQGYIQKYGSPFESWPLLKEPTEVFLRFFEAGAPMPEQQGGTSLGSQRVIDAKQLQAMIEEFDKEIEAAKQGRVDVRKVSQRFITDLTNKAKQAKVPLSEAKPPAPPAAEGVPVPGGAVTEIPGVAVAPTPAAPQAKAQAHLAVEGVTAPGGAVTEIPGVAIAPVPAAPQAKAQAHLAVEGVTAPAAQIKETPGVAVAPTPAAPQVQVPVPQTTENVPVSPLYIPKSTHGVMQQPPPHGEERVSISHERVKKFVIAAISHPGPPEEKTAIFRVLEQIEQPNVPVSELLPRAVAVVEAAEVLTTPWEDLPREASFVTLATGSGQKNIAKVLDLVVPAATKEAVIGKILLQPLETIVNHPEALPQNVLSEMVSRWGEDFINTPWFANLRADTNHMMADQQGAVKIKSRFTIFVENVIRISLGIDTATPEKNVVTVDSEALTREKPVAAQIAKAFAQGKNVLVVDKNASVTGTGISILILGKDAVVSGTVSAQIKEIRDVLAPGKNVLILDKKVFDARKAAAPRIVEAPAPGKIVFVLNKKALTAWKSVSAVYYNIIAYIETYRLVATGGIPMGNMSHYGNIVLGYGEQLVHRGAKYAVRAWSKKIAGRVATKTAVNAIGKTAIQALLGGASGGTSFLVTLGLGAVNWLKNKGAAILKGLLFMGGTKEPYDNLLLIVGAGVVLMFFLPLFPLLNTPAFNQSMIDTSLATAGADSGPGGPTVPGAPEGERVVWAYSGTAPVTASSQLGCPVRGGIITQGPGGSFSHQGIQAYDFANSMGSPIYATHDAYVVSFHDGIAPYTFLNHSYGNYVLLVGQLPNGQKFFTMYAHLLSVDPIVLAALNGKRTIRAGEIIGYEDATGSTWGGSPGGTGIHLHYQSQGLGALVLPPGCP
jgi:murein DD-endopeptidase MepM/ murein hydrolase activator NlpD